MNRYGLVATVDLMQNKTCM